MPPESPVPRPRVLHCLTGLGLGGAERSTITLIGRLADRFQFGVHTMLPGIADDVGREMHAELTSLGVPCYFGTRLPIKWGGMATGGRSMARALRAFRPHIVHLHTEIPEAGYAAMISGVGALRAIPLARTIHNARYWHHWTPIGRWCERRMPPAHIVGVAQDALDAYETFARGTGSRPVSTSVIYNAPKIAALPPRIHTPNTPLRLLFAGRFEFQKGADLLPAILAGVSPDTARLCELTILGSGQCLPALQALVARPPAGWKIQLGPPQASFTAQLAQFDLVLMPSRFEGVGMIAIEALVQRVPLVATSSIGLREAFPPDYPWLAAPGDAAAFARVLEQALRERARWPAVASSAQAFARERFALPKMASAYERLYQRILANTP